MMSISGTRWQSLDGILKVLPLEWFGIDPFNYVMDNPFFIVFTCMENSIRIQRVKP